MTTAAIIALVALALDGLTTWYGLRRGHGEANPIYRRAWLLWALLALRIGLVVACRADQFVCSFIIAVTGAVVIGNVLTIAGRRPSWLPWFALAIAVLPARAQCVTAACSDDPGVLGNEVVVCDPTPLATRYKFCTDDEARCAWTTAPTINALGAGLLDPDPHAATLHPLIRIKVAACNDREPSQPTACGGWSAFVEFLPYACVRTSRCYPDPRHPDQTRCDACEYRCAPGAPRRLPRLPECTP